MKKVMLVCLVIVVVSGCVSAKYNPKTSAADYFRFGDIKAKGVDITLPGGATIKIESQSSEAAMLHDALQVIEKGIAIGAGVK